MSESETKPADAAPVELEKAPEVPKTEADAPAEAPAVAAPPVAASEAPAEAEKSTTEPATAETAAAETNETEVTTAAAGTTEAIPAAESVPTEAPAVEPVPTEATPAATTAPAAEAAAEPAKEEAAETKEVKKEAAPAPATPILQLWEAAKAQGHPEIWGVTLADPESHIPTRIVLQKYLNANDGDLVKSKDQLIKTLEWRAKTQPLELVKKAYSKGKFEGLGFVTNYSSEEASVDVPESKETFTWNVYGSAKSIDETFGKLEEFLEWRVALMELALQDLSLATATKAITADYDPYKIYQVHDYKDISFLRQSAPVKSASSETIRVFAQNYPELLKEKFFVNVPVIMGFMYNFIKLFVAAKTAKKFHPLSNGNNLAHEFGQSKVKGLADKLPTEYGGKGGDLKTQGTGPALDGPREAESDEPREAEGKSANTLDGNARGSISPRPMDTTYLALTRAIPDRLNLSNIASAPASQPCAHCCLVVPDRARAENGLIKTAYDRVDEYPDFPGLKATAKAGCELCRLLRKAVRAQWVARPMAERGLGALSEKDGLWDEMFGMPWDRKVRIYNPTFTFALSAAEKAAAQVPPASAVDAADLTLRLAPKKRTEEEGQGKRQAVVVDPAGNKGESEELDLRRGGVVTTLFFEFGPATTARDDTGAALHGEIVQTVNFAVFDSPDLQSSDVDTQRRLPSQWTLSDENIDLMRHWIGRCCDSHPGCSEPEPWTPSRLVDIGTDPLNPEPRLIEATTTTVHDDGGGDPRPRLLRYCALSHMWGDPSVLPPLRTLQANYAAFRARLRMPDLPQNFRDAVYVCGALGIRYVWIDSLCIVQDSPADWAREAARMHLVYRHAVVTLVAASAVSSHDGFLRRDVSLAPCAKVRYSPVGQGSSSSSSSSSTEDADAAAPRSGTRTMILSPRDPDDKGHRSRDVDESRWNSRGWTMQERSLSSRLLYFCRDKIYFECRGVQWSEENEPQEALRGLFGLWPREDGAAAVLPDGGGLSSADAGKLYLQWRTAVSEYSGRALSYAADKLVAIRSVAAEMERRVVDDEYIASAGMWYGDLPEELAWYVSAGSIASRPPRRRAPSWSWAALDGRVGFANGTRGATPLRADYAELFARHPFAVVGLVAPELDTSSSPPPPRLRLRGVARPIRLMTKLVTDDYWVPIERGLYMYDLAATNPAEGTGAGAEGETPVFAHGTLDLDNRDGVLSRGYRLLYLHVTYTSHPNGLILAMPPSQGTEEVWERVGVATLFRLSGPPILDDSPQDWYRPTTVTVA